MNNVSLVGRMTADPKLNHTTKGTACVNFAVATERSYPNKDGNRGVDFIPVSAYGKSAVYITQYFKKGKPISIIGKLENGSYEKEGQTIPTLTVIVESATFVPSEPKAKAVEATENEHAETKQEE